MFNRVEVRAVARKVDQGVTMVFKQCFDVGVFMEGGIVDDEGGRLGEVGDKIVL